MLPLSEVFLPRIGVTVILTVHRSHIAYMPFSADVAARPAPISCLGHSQLLLDKSSEHEIIWFIFFTTVAPRLTNKITSLPYAPVKTETSAYMSHFQQVRNGFYQDVETRLYPLIFVEPRTTDRIQKTSKPKVQQERKTSSCVLNCMTMYIHIVNSLLSPSITPSFFHCRLKTYLFHKSFAP